MNPIDPATQLAALIRVQVASLRRRQETRRPGGQRGAPAAPVTGEAQPDLATVVARHIRLIDPVDPQRERKALRIFLESVLLSELGQHLANDPSFASMVDHVQAQMESDATLAEASREAAQLLLKNADAGGAAT